MSETRRPPRAVPGRPFLEPPELKGSFGIYLRPDRVLLARDTPHQRLEVIEAGPLGRVLLLDGNIQLTQFDHHAYHELLAHVPLLSHPAPRRALIIGGGDGGLLTEALKHPSLERVDLCEIDAAVIAAGREFFPAVAAGFNDPRARVHIGDGAAFVKNIAEPYDVILVDASDPEGPAVPLFGREFYAGLRRALAPGGLIAGQSESVHLYPDLAAAVAGFMRALFPRAWHYTAQVPTYLSGVIGFALGSDGPDPLATPDPERLAALGPLMHYTPAVHQAAFALPARWLEILGPQG
ncbi:MAG: polyamine aminopropyltransferase [Pseudomonadota bacterium]